jgi:hypothetical protein
MKTRRPYYRLPSEGRLITLNQERFLWFLSGMTFLFLIVVITDIITK